MLVLLPLSGVVIASYRLRAAGIVARVPSFTVVGVFESLTRELTWWSRAPALLSPARLSSSEPVSTLHPEPAEKAKPQYIAGVLICITN